MNFREILEFSSVWHSLQTLKISDSIGDASRSYGRLNVVNFTLACCVFKCIKFLTLKHSYLQNSSMNFREILEFSSICYPLQTLKISDSIGDDSRSYGRLNVVNFTLASCVFKCIKFLTLKHSYL